MEQSRKPSWSLARTPEGPLAARIGAFTSLLVNQGYAAFSAHIETRLVADFSRWLLRRRVALPDITQRHADQYLRSRVKIKYSSFTASWEECVIPVAVERMTLEIDRGEFFVGDFGAGGIA